MAKDNYCDIQEHCKPLLAANRQYKKVVAQNRSLQGELNNTKEELEYLASFFNKDETAIVNRLLRYNRAINAIKEIADDAMQCKGIGCDYAPKILKEIERIGE